MNTTNRWIFQSNYKGTIKFKWEGKPEDIPGFQGWIKTRRRTGTKKVKSVDGKIIYKEPTVLYEGKLYYGYQITHTPGKGAPCSTNCRRATRPICHCSCQGKNHGIDNPGMDYFDESEVIYLG